jgi:hypothetical protein
MGFRRLWFSDSIEFCGERSAGAIVVCQYQDIGLGVRFGVESAAEADAIGARYEASFGVALQQSNSTGR